MKVLRSGPVSWVFELGDAFIEAMPEFDAFYVYSKEDARSFWASSSRLGVLGDLGLFQLGGALDGMSFQSIVFVLEQALGGSGCFLDDIVA